MRVVHLIKGLGRGGAESLLVQTTRHATASFDFGVGYFLPWKDSLVGELADAGVTAHCFVARSAPGMLVRVPAVARWLREQRADIVHAHLPVAGVVARLAAKLARVPLVYSEHNLQERYHPMTRWANRASWRLQDEVVAVSEEVAGSIASRMPRSVPVSVVRNGIAIGDTEPCSRARVRQVHGISGDAPVVGTVAVFRSQKRLDLWLDVAQRVAHEVPDVRFLLVGDGPLRGEVEVRVTSSGLGERVVLAGLQAEARRYYAAFDVFLMTSEFEGLPLALLEAMAAGTAVVATEVGGIPEVVRDGVEGRLASFGDVGALASRVIELLRDEPQRQRLAANARSRVEAEFSVQRMERELEAVYLRVAARGVSARA